MMDILRRLFSSAVTVVQTLPKSLSPSKPNPQPLDTLVALVMWGRSYGIPRDYFVLHTVCPERHSKACKSRDVNFLHWAIPKGLRSGLNEFWVDVEWYGNQSKYPYFWGYIWKKHGNRSGMNLEEFFTGGVELIKSLPPELNLEKNAFIRVESLLAQIRATLNVACGVSTSRVRGFVLINGTRYYSPKIIDQIYIATDLSYNRINIHKQLWGDVNGDDEVILPIDTMYRYKNPAGRDIVLVKGQSNHDLHLKQEYGKMIRTEMIFKVAEPISFTILENVETRETMGILVVSSRVPFDPFHPACKDFVACTGNCTTYLVVLTDMDSNGWDMKKLNEYKRNILRRFSNLKPTHSIVPISLEHNVNKKVGQVLCDWYKGESLRTCIDKFEARKIDGRPLRMLVHEIDPANLVIGDVHSGRIFRGDWLFVMPSKARVQVVQIFKDGVSCDSAEQDDYVQIKLSHTEDFEKGCVVCSISDPIPLILEFEAEVCLLEDLSSSEGFGADFRAAIHIHYCVVECTIASLVSEFHPRTRVLARFCPPYVYSRGSLVQCIIKVDRVIPVEKFSHAIGEFVLHFKGKFIATGKVIAYRY